VPVENRIVKVQKRNRALVRFDPARICNAILRAARSIGGFQQDCVRGANEALFKAWPSDEQLATFLAEAVTVLLNSHAHHLIANFPPTIESIQDAVLHVLRGYGFQNSADAYACYRWGRHWLREGAIQQPQFVGNGLPLDQIQVSREWNHTHGCDSLPGLNKLIQSGGLKSLIQQSLTEYEQSLKEASEKISSRIDSGQPLRMVWVTGPSSSGKTTTTLKLKQLLEKRGLNFLVLNLDDYFWSLVEHPTDWINDRNYEQPQAIDIQLLNEHLRALLLGKTIEKPVFDFKRGLRTGSKPIRLETNQILLLDCLHGFYPPLTEGIELTVQFRVYLEVQSGLCEPDGGPAPIARSADIRLLRRMLRDVRHRSYSPLRTLLHWHYVRAGELFSILPLSGLADHVINTGSPFELALLKPFFSGPNSHLPDPQELAAYRGFMDAEIRYHRIRHLFDSVQGVTAEQLHGYDLLPGDAVLREFIGGGTLSVPHND
jgi:uridine kinase